MAKLKKHYENKQIEEPELPLRLRKKSISAFALESSLVDFKGIQKSGDKMSE